MTTIWNFLVLYFHTYDITTEVVMLGLAGILYTLILFSKPEKTYMMKLFLFGLGSAVLIMVLHIILLGETIRMTYTHSYVVFNIIYFLYTAAFISVLEAIFAYQVQLAYIRRSQRKFLTLLEIFFGIIWTTLMLLPLFNGTLLESVDGKYIMSKSSDIYILCSFTDAILCIGIIIANKKHVSKIVHYGSLIFVPVELFAIAAQLYFHTAYFVCATFTLPFLIYFLLFHANKYDEVTGCQSYDAYKNYLDRLIKQNKEFIHLSLSTPAMETVNLSENKHTIISICNRLSHKIEETDPRIRVYSISNFNYVIMCTVKDETENQFIVDKLISILTEPVQTNDSHIKIPINFLVSKKYNEISTVDEYILLLKYNEKQFWNLGNNQIIKISDDDAKAFKRYSYLEKNIQEIKYSQNLDDPRVLMFVQPIHKLSSEDFRTGECLMRLKIDENMYYPDEFIPIAEACDCIHALTKIMLYKASCLTTVLNENSQFDALTVNVSTVELMEPNVSDEFAAIIKRANASPENIRIEITESTKVINYDKVLETMNQLHNMGIKFYLDDFGTGYSNLDRVISMPFSTIKFDKSLLYKALEDKKTNELFKFLATFFKQKGISLVVEGVENQKQKDYATSVGFDYIQGYLYSKPIPALESTGFFTQKQ